MRHEPGVSKGQKGGEGEGGEEEEEKRSHTSNIIAVVMRTSANALETDHS
jgi:hypothetical protein